MKPTRYINIAQQQCDSQSKRQDGSPVLRFESRSVQVYTGHCQTRHPYAEYVNELRKRM